MKISKLATISTAVAVLMLVFDIYLISNYGRQAASDIEWWKIGGALLVQIFAYVFARIRESLIRQGFKFQQDPDGISYRNYVPVITVGVVCAALAISSALLEIAIVCPHQSMPVVRGVPVCPQQSKIP